MSDSAFCQQPTEPSLSSLSSKEIPEQIGPYDIRALLHQGGMSSLYLGVHQTTGELHAIKVLSKEHL
ncbi:MAG: hypothetical protein FJZ58_04820, partial [Chlamydiae bacterium]|nr:hypothetical protein [Chlamydiota bacterium]